MLRSVRSCKQLINFETLVLYTCDKFSQPKFHDVGFSQLRSDLRTFFCLTFTLLSKASSLLVFRALSEILDQRKETRIYYTLYRRSP